MKGSISMGLKTGSCSMINIVQKYHLKKEQFQCCVLINVLMNSLTKRTLLFFFVYSLLHSFSFPLCRLFRSFVYKLPFLRQFSHPIHSLPTIYLFRFHHIEKVASFIVMHSKCRSLLDYTWYENETIQL